MSVPSWAPARHLEVGLSHQRVLSRRSYCTHFPQIRNDMLWARQVVCTSLRGHTHNSSPRLGAGEHPERSEIPQAKAASGPPRWEVYSKSLCWVAAERFLESESSALSATPQHSPPRSGTPSQQHSAASAYPALTRKAGGGAHGEEGKSCVLRP